MIEDIGADEYKIEENEKEYILRIGSTNNKINLNLSTRDNQQFKNYSGEFTLDDLRRINRVFLLTPTIFDAKEEFKKAVERKKIAISERDDYIHTVFYMMIGTDTSTLSIALPRDETPRIIRLEQNLNILKLGRDNLSDRLAVFEREAEEIKRDLDRIQMGNNTLQQIADTIGQGIPDVSEILREYKANKNNPNYTSYQMAQPQFEDQPYSSANLKNMDQPYSSANFNQIEPIKESLNEQNRESSLPNENADQGNFNIDANNLDVNPSLGSEEQEQGDRFPNGIIKNIIKEQGEIDFVVNKIAEKFPGCKFNLLYKGSTDGDTAADFHSKCDDAEKTLVIVEDNYGNRFGGFTTQDWGGQYMQKR